MAKPAPDPSQLEVLSSRTRQAAEQVGQIGKAIVFSHGLPAVDRANRIRGFGTEIITNLIPVFSYLELNKPDAAALTKDWAEWLLRAAIQAVEMYTPEYAGGILTDQSSGEPSDGSKATTEVAIHARLFAGHLVDMAAEFDAAIPTIWHHGGRAFSRDRINPIIVTEAEALILGAFLDAQGPMDTATLVNTAADVTLGMSNIPRIINRLRVRYRGVFADAIRMAGSRGSGGYHIRVRPLKN